MRTSVTVGSLSAIVILAAGLFVAGCGPEYPNCDSNEDCHKGEFCVNGQCQKCRTNEDCPAGERCAGGRCEPIPGYCESNGDCPDGQECQDNRCVEVTQETTPTTEPTTTEPETKCSLETVYFAFDSSNLSQDARDTLESNAECIQERDLDSVHLTGHCDPRGTEEYNLALGERRARSTKEYLTSLGVSSGVLSISSMGEEMASGTGEASWAKDRKVVFSIR